MRTGRLVLAFDSSAWSEHHDVGDNSIFYRPAEVVAEHTLKSGERVVDLRWLGGSHVSRAHFLHALKPWPPGDDRCRRPAASPPQSEEAR